MSYNLKKKQPYCSATIFNILIRKEREEGREPWDILRGRESWSTHGWQRKESPLNCNMSKQLGWGDLKSNQQKAGQPLTKLRPGSSTWSWFILGYLLEASVHSAVNSGDRGAEVKRSLNSPAFPRAVSGSYLWEHRSTFSVLWVPVMDSVLTRISLLGKSSTTTFNPRTFLEKALSLPHGGLQRWNCAIYGARAQQW